MPGFIKTLLSIICFLALFNVTAANAEPPIVSSPDLYEGLEPHTRDNGCKATADIHFWPPDNIPSVERNKQSCIKGRAGQRERVRLTNALKIQNYKGPWSSDPASDDATSDDGWDIRDCYCARGTNWNGSACVTAVVTP